MLLSYLCIAFRLAEGKCSMRANYYYEICQYMSLENPQLSPQEQHSMGSINMPHTFLHPDVEWVSSYDSVTFNSMFTQPVHRCWNYECRGGCRTPSLKCFPLFTGFTIWFNDFQHPAVKIAPAPLSLWCFFHDYQEECQLIPLVMWILDYIE